jgi:ABC-2 type transport system permease protein
VSTRITLATAERLLRQLRHDPRTVALLLAVPVVLLVLLRYLLDGRPQVFQRVGAPLCGLFTFIVMFLITSVAMLRERTTGTLERLMASPAGRPDLLAGYGLAFGAVALAQAVVVCLVGFAVLGLKAAHGVWLVGGLAVGNAVLGMALGLFASAFARSEFQAVQFMPAIVLPQLLLCGLFGDRAEMAPVLRTLSDALPLTYAYDALTRTTSASALGSGLLADVAVIAGTTVLALGLGAVTLRRRTP